MATNTLICSELTIFRFAFVGRRRLFGLFSPPFDNVSGQQHHFIFSYRVKRHSFI